MARAKLAKSKLKFAYVATSVVTALILAGSTLHAQSQIPMSDQAISDKIADELLMDPAVSSMKVDVNVADGIVKLKGEVNNILAKERALRIAETVKGVRSVVNTIAVKPSPFRSDMDIQQDIEAALLDDPATESYEIEANVSDGMATLTGTVDSYQERELAETVAKGVRGVTGLKQRIAVRYKSDRFDHEIKHEIEQALRWNARVDNHLINVAVDAGKVSLSGTVGSAAEKRLAEASAWIAGVKSVDISKLSVEGWAREDKLRGDKFIVKSESALHDAVSDALAHDPRVLPFGVDVEVAGSMVTLRGTVDNLMARRAAEQDAYHTTGVSTVNNRLKVRPDAPPTDKEMASLIRAQFMRDPYVERFEISTTVVAGTAHLYGVVDSQFEKNRADELASRVNGVVDVRNHLTVDADIAYIYDPFVDKGYVDRDEIIDFDKRAPSKTDTQLQNAIDSELWWSPFVNADEVSVAVDDGVATLTGTVDSWSERRKATENAYEGGASLVDNDLAVRNDY